MDNTNKINNIENIDLSIALAGIKLDNPTVLASGILGVTKDTLRNVRNNGAGAVTIKSISREPRKGHPNPTIISFGCGMLNAVGYSNSGWEAAKEEFKNLKDVGCPVFASIIGQSPEDFEFLAENFLTNEFGGVEIPLSCPHTPGFGMLGGQGTPEATKEITRIVKKNSKLPVFVKISASVPAIAEVAKAAESAGADAITAVNTVAGMVINPEARKPVLGFKMGGVSGPALKPIAIRCVYDIYKAVKIPIIGTGGITTGRDAVEMIMAGATAIGIGSAVNYRGIDVFKKITDEIKEFMEKEGYTKLDQLRGAVHE